MSTVNTLLVLPVKILITSGEDNIILLSCLAEALSLVRRREPAALRLDFDRSPSTTECLRSRSLVKHHSERLLACAIVQIIYVAAPSPPLSVTSSGHVSACDHAGLSQSTQELCLASQSGMSPLPHDLATETLRTRPVADEDLCILVLLFISAPVVLGAKEHLSPRWLSGQLHTIGRCIVFRSEDHGCRHQSYSPIASRICPLPDLWS